MAENKRYSTEQILQKSTCTILSTKKTCFCNIEKKSVL